MPRGANIRCTPNSHSPVGITSGLYYDAGAITVSDTMSATPLTITGKYVQQTAGVIAVTNGSSLSFFTGGIPGANPEFEGSIGLRGSIGSDSKMALSGATLTSASDTNTVIGDLFVYDGGTISVGVSGVSTSTLEFTTGSLTVGSSSAAPNAGATGATLDILTGSTVAFPASAGTDTFVVTKQGVLNMYGSFITMSTRIASLQFYASDSVLLPAGNLNSYGAAGLIGASIVDNIAGSVTVDGAAHVHRGLGVSGTVSVAGTLDLYGATFSAASLLLDGKLTTHGGGGDSITLSSGAGTFTNNGTLVFAGSLHTLALTGNYVQGSGGMLEMRLADGPANDDLLVTGTATLDGTLKLTGSVAANQLWTIIGTGGGILGAFANIYFPDGNLNWIGGDNGFDFQVQN